MICHNKIKVSLIKEGLRGLSENCFHISTYINKVRYQVSNDSWRQKYFSISIEIDANSQTYHRLSCRKLCYIFDFCYNFTDVSYRRRWLTVLEICITDYQSFLFSPNIVVTNLELCQYLYFFSILLNFQGRMKDSWNDEIRQAIEVTMFFWI